MQQPTCSHCRRGARTCSKESDHIILGDANVGIVRRRTRYDLSFDEDQIWMGLPSGKMPGKHFFWSFGEPTSIALLTITGVELTLPVC
jgi:hypothetical protein